ncbi:hypothetical protein [Paenibacillus sp. S150]|uniref:hypothetical protein n=1 Tax=Paenibacillus sp. S150 TaxID=2749826 RepID=UPI001C59EF1F|nr:hypothetical protein [Paenibacillus sp. S150]MBW4082451.1 hypothetical protein [Paenibacillus sp. S150]
MTINSSYLSYNPHRMQYDVINRWLLSDILTRNIRFEPMTMEGDVNDWLIKGFSIHENPCRKEFVDARRSSEPVLSLAMPPVPGECVSLEDPEARWNLYFPWGNPRVEESGFYHVPTHLLRYAYTGIVSPMAHKAVFNLKTCGGVALWVNGRLVCDFTPFTRNMEQKTQVEIQLEAGENVFFVCHEDLAERDTLYHYTLEYTGSASLEIRVPLTELESAGAVLDMEHALGKAYFPKSSVTDEEIQLAFTQPFSRDILFDVNYTSFFDSQYSMQRVLGAGQHSLSLGHTDDFGAEYQLFELVAHVGKAAVRKVFGIELHNSRFQPRDSQAMTIEERKRTALECVAAFGIPNVHTAIARLKTGYAPGQVREMIMKELAGIQKRQDCSDFYLIALFRLWRDYRDRGLFDDAFWEEIKETILGFRYWIDEPGDDVMWFFSENHALLFHSCQLLAGQLFPECTFTNSGETGAQRQVKAERQLLEWFQRFFAEGLAEWNSTAYIPIDFLGLVQLYELAQLPEIHRQAKRAMDLLYSYMTAEAHEGYLMSTLGRSYERVLVGNYSAGTTSLMWMGYGVGNVNSSAFNVPLYLSDYKPPQSYAERIRLSPEEELEFQLEQGKDGYAKLIHYRTASFVMSSISDFRPGLKGYQEHVLHLAFSPEAQVWVNHPGEVYAHGSGRPCFWAGNGILPKVGQYKGLGILMFAIDPEHDADYTHAYFPTYAFTRFEQQGSWFFGESEGAYTAVYAANGLALTREGINRERELVSEGRRNIWLIRAAARQEHGSFRQYIEEVLNMPVVAATETMQVCLTDYKYGEIRFGWQEPLSVNGESLQFRDCGVNGRLLRRERG